MVSIAKWWNVIITKFLICTVHTTRYTILVVRTIQNWNVNSKHINCYLSWSSEYYFNIPNTLGSLQQQFRCCSINWCGPPCRYRRTDNHSTRCSSLSIFRVKIVLYAFFCVLRRVCTNVIRMLLYSGSIQLLSWKTLSNKMKTRTIRARPDPARSTSSEKGSHSYCASHLGCDPLSRPFTWLKSFSTEVVTSSNSFWVSSMRDSILRSIMEMRRRIQCSASGRLRFFSIGILQ